MIGVCEVYWSSHGCKFQHGHDGPHICDCCDCDDHAGNQGRRVDEDGSEWTCNGAPPYLPGERFYGDDTTEAEREGRW